MKKLNREVEITKARYDIVPDPKQVHKGKEVICLTDGNVFKSAKEAAAFYGVGYVTLVNHLGGAHKSVGRETGSKYGTLQFAYINTLSYKADDVSHRIIDLKAREMSTKEAMNVLRAQMEMEIERVRQEAYEHGKRDAKEKMVQGLLTLVG